MISTGYPYQQQMLESRFDFYSGSQITVWLGNIYLDDINSIQWVRTQNKMPIYGYASQLFDAVANGTVLVQGNFTINFRQQGYLPAIVRTIKDLYAKFNPDSPSSKSQNIDTWNTVQSLISKHLKNGTFGPNTAEEIKELGNSQDFFELAKEYEKIVWGEAGSYDTDVRYPADVQQAMDIPDGFNIMVSYGNPSNTEMQTKREVMQSTVKTLIGVHLVGEAQTIMVGGQPVQEQYNFIARNTDKFLGTSR